MPNIRLPPPRVDVQEIVYRYPATNCRTCFVHYVRGYRFEATWTMAQTARANLHSKNKCLMDSSCWQKTHVLLPCQMRRARLSLVKMTPLLRNQRNIFTLRGILSFHNFLLSTGTSLWPIASYKDLTEKLLFWCKFHRNLSGSPAEWPPDECVTHSMLPGVAQKGPYRKKYQVFFCPNTCLIMTNLCLTILYKLGYCTISGVAPSQVSSQNRTWEPSLTEKVPNWKKNSLAFITPLQKCESLGFQWTWEMALDPTYLLLMISCHTPFSESSL
jgi:hypothetical protein